MRAVYTQEQRRELRAERLALLDQAVAELKSSDAWARWLKVRRSFHAYSWRNQLLIATQRPDTLAVRGLRQWPQLHRRVKKGSKAIWILAPAPYKTGEVLDNGDPVKRTYFKPVGVFAYEDTEQIPGEPVIDIEPPLRPIVGDELAPQLQTLSEWLIGHGVSAVHFETIPGSAHGWYRPADTLITIDSTLSPNQQFKTLVHEACHHLAQAEQHTWSSAEEEVVVESAAYAVCATLGLETAAYSAGYVAHWREGGPAPQDLLAAVDGFATRIEEALECT